MAGVNATSNVGATFTKNTNFEKFVKDLKCEKILKNAKKARFNKCALIGLSGVALVAGTKAVVSLFDSEKGSMTNRQECAIEHLKNDSSLVAKFGLVGLAGALLKKSPKTVEGVGKAIVKVGKKAFQIFSKSTEKKLPEIIKKLAKNPKKVGAMALVLAGGIYLVNALFKNVEKMGRIDQKYEDAAKIESKTKNVILQNLNSYDVEEE